MSHGSEQSEDYWPGYVDALTSMVQVLAFVMMMLAVTVFVMSQSISKGAVEQIAKAAKVAPSSSSSVKELTEKIVEQLNKAEAKPEVQVKSETLTKSETLAKTEAPAQPETQAQPGGQANTEAPAKPETQAKSEAQPAGNSPANIVVKQSAAVAPQAQAEKDIEMPPDAKRIVVQFPDRSSRLDLAGAEQVNGFVDETGLAAGKLRVVIHAFAASGTGAVTEGRRLAYSRAMVARQALTARKVPPTSIAIRMIDTADPAQGGKIEIYAVSPGAP